MTTLFSTDIGSTAGALEIFGREKGLLIVRPGRSCLLPWFEVDSAHRPLCTARNSPAVPH